MEIVTFFAEAFFSLASFAQIKFHSISGTSSLSGVRFFKRMNLSGTLLQNEIIDSSNVRPLLDARARVGSKYEDKASRFKNYCVIQYLSVLICLVVRQNSIDILAFRC